MHKSMFGAIKYTTEIRTDAQGRVITVLVPEISFARDIEDTDTAKKFLGRAKAGGKISAIRNADGSQFTDGDNI